MEFAPVPGRPKLAVLDSTQPDQVRNFAASLDLAHTVFVVSSNLDDSYMVAGPGVVTELNPATMEVVRTFEVGTNPQYAAAYNGKLYVVNSGDFAMNNGTLSVIR